jgi:PmbA protein
MVIEKYTNHKIETSLNLVQSKIDSVRRKDISKTGIRVYENGFIGVAGGLGDTDDSALASEAFENKIAYSAEPSKEKTENISYKDELMKDEEFVEEIDSLVNTINKTQPKFIFSNKINLVSQETILKNNAGLSLSCKDRFLAVEMAFKEKSSVNIMDGGIIFYGRKYNRNNLVDITNAICNAYSNKLDFTKEGTYPVVFSTLDGLPLSKIVKDLNGKLFATGSSIFSNKLGSKLFNENFSLYQSNNCCDGFSPFFDAEGIVNNNYTYEFIKDGILLSPYTDKRTALKYNLPLTGTAAADYDSVPDIGFPNLKIKESEKTLKELLGGEKAIFVALSSGGDFTPDGNFAAPIQLPLLFDGEHFIGRLPELQISSNLYEMFGSSYRGVGKDYLNPYTIEKHLILDMNVSKL